MVTPLPMTMKSSMMKGSFFRIVKLVVFAAVAFVILFGGAYLFALDKMMTESEVSQQPRITDSTERGAVKIFFVGNSLTYTHSIPTILQRFIEAGQHKQTKIWQIALPSRLFEQHAKDGLAADILSKHGPFDYVVLQGQSTEPYMRPQHFIYYGWKLAKLAEQSGAKPILFQTYADEGDLASQEKLTRGYEELSKQTVAPVVPVGEAWFYALSENPKLKLWSADRHHPSGEGAYYSACVFYAYLFRASPESLPAKITGHSESRNRDVVIVDLPPAKAKQLQQLAWEYFQAHRPGTALVPW